ncbi:26570adc-fcd2-46a6-9a65-d6da9bd97b33 [Sclerotinia trifoliorum]|uniref:26570adc-fcd2-46a6-9a65-d6da9bd97b33 n=1 Tax=Sclerotinia trifoliorum TaxID=28548 RepID=A0A8H2W0Q7_9HELO|nr:26570adc-fcd2-46a6-9a65-d6da9bd97b33 [Sclerotinia trifoliorum]
MMEETILARITRPRVSSSSWIVSVLLVLCSCITSTTFGYDGSMMNGLNILPSYTDYFNLNTATLSLNTAALWIGGAVAGLTYGQVTDKIGRRYALFWAAIGTFLSVVLQTAAQNTAMFVIARILVGYGTSASTLTGPTYVAETLPYNWRAWGLGVLNDCYYVGGLIAAGVTYRTASYSSTWAWRVPSLVQGIFSVLCIAILPFIPESPRWLAYVGRTEEALMVVAQTHANGDTSNPVVLAQYQEIIDTIEYERNVGETLSLKQMVKTPVARKRVSLAISAAVISTISGNVIASYYLGTMLDNAGISDATTQLEINIILNAWCLCCALFGTYYADILGRRAAAIISTSLLTIFLFIVGALTKVYGTSKNKSGVYGTVAAIFLFQGAYSFGWTPLLYLYPPEVLNYSIRANGMGLFTFVLNGVALLIVFSFPFAQEAMGWKIYMMNGAWDVLEVGLIWKYWVETRGKTLEEIDEMFEGIKHSDVPDLKDVVEVNVKPGDDVPERIEIVPSRKSV